MKKANPKKLVQTINERLIWRGLPSWMVNMTDAELKDRAKEGGYKDCFNVPESALLVAMMIPARVGIPEWHSQ